MVKVIKAFIHRRTNQGGHAGKGEGSKRGLDFAVQKMMRRRLLWVLEALSEDTEFIKSM